MVVAYALVLVLASTLLEAGGLLDSVAEASLAPGEAPSALVSAAASFRATAAARPVLPAPDAYRLAPAALRGPRPCSVVPLVAPGA